MRKKNIKFEWFVGFRPNNYIMCERLGNFWSLHQYLYSPKRFALFCLLTINLECFTLLQSGVESMGKMKLKMKQSHKHLPCVWCTVKIMLPNVFILSSRETSTRCLLWWVLCDATDDAELIFILYSFYEWKLCLFFC